MYTVACGTEEGIGCRHNTDRLDTTRGWLACDAYLIDTSGDDAGAYEIRADGPVWRRQGWAPRVLRRFW